jgi:ABC-2 type transport system ATP-binding protein
MNAVVARPVMLEAALRLGAGRGHGGLKIVVLVLIVAAAAAGVVVVHQRRRVRSTSRPRLTLMRGHGAPSMRSVEPTQSVEPVTPIDDELTPAKTRLADVGATPAKARPIGVGKGRSTIEARDLTKRYGDKIALDDLSFDVRSGHVTGFLGPNGAGKSTTMRLIMGLDMPNSGTVTVNGHRYHDLAWPLREVGALLEAKAIHPGRSAYSHLLMLAQTNHIPARRVDEVLDLVGLTSVARQLAGNFSLGMGQRLGIAEALLGDPGVLLFDEPVNGLDTDGIRWVRGLLRRLASEGRTVFVSSHLMSEMALTADQVVVIGKGHLIAEMPVEQFTSRNAQRYVRVRSPQLDRLQPALQAAGASVALQDDGSVSVRGLDAEKIGELTLRESIVLSELTPQTASLEDAFIESTEGDLEYRGDHPQPPLSSANGAST